MTDHVSAREARARFAELTDQVRYTGEPVIVEKQGRPFVAMVRVQDVEELERLRAWSRQSEFSRLAATAAHAASDPEPDDDEIVRRIRATRSEDRRAVRGG